MTVLAIIPARGGSKGIPRKNLAPLCGRPLVAWAIQAALGSRYIERVVVSTDDPEIGHVSKTHGADVVWRPPELSGDLASSEEALLHCLEWLGVNEAYHPDMTVFLQCTAPLIRAQEIDGTIEALKAEQADSGLAATDFYHFLWHRNDAGDAVGVNHDKRRRLMRQQREPSYLETGAVYAMRTAGFLQARHRFFGKIVFHVVPRERCWEIDDPVDLEIAQVLLRNQLEGKRRELLPARIAGVVMDFDGVLTDNRAFVLQDGQEAIVANRSDGLGIALLRQAGLQLLVLSSEHNPVVRTRCDKLRIPCIQGVHDKRAALSAWLNSQALSAKEVVFVGNDVNDVDCLSMVGCGVAVSDGHPKAKAAAQIILSAPGGRGAIRELADLILQQYGRSYAASA